MTAEAIRVFVADDHRLFRDGLRALFASLTDIEVVGEADTGEQVVERVAETSPDVILMDIQMPGLNGIEATRRVVEQHPSVGVIVVTMLEDDDSVFAAMRAGARGYILKGAGQEEMLRAIRSVAQGEALFGPGIATRLERFFTHVEERQETAFPELTDREREVLDLVARGENKSAIADRLSIATKTVSNHLSNIYNKLQVADRAEAMLRAREAGFGREQ